jgi:hypothetical protein
MIMGSLIYFRHHFHGGVHPTVTLILLGLFAVLCSVVFYLKRRG